MSGSVRVRIAVAVDGTGRWTAYGWSFEADETAMRDAIGQVADGASRFWLEAELPLPVVPVIAAEVEMSERDAIRMDLNAAHAMVSALCKPRNSEGSREWRMSIPARPDYDPDLVIGRALRHADKLLAAAPPDSLSPGPRTETQE